MNSIIKDLGKDGLQKLLDESNTYAEIFEKFGMSQHGNNYDTLRKYIKEFDLDLSQINENRKIYNSKLLEKGRREIPVEDIITGRYKEIYKGTSLKKRLINAGYKEYKCECCGMTEWLGNPIPLQLHHKDGNHYNNLLQNLQLLCPNCHALTDNFGAKNIKNKREEESGQKRYVKTENKKEICPVCGINYKSVHAKTCQECYHKSIRFDIERDKLKAEIRTMPFLKIGEKYGVTDNAVRKWCIRLNLPSTKKEINSIKDEDWVNI